MFAMNTQTKVIFTTIIAVTAMLALSPLLSSNVMAAKGGVNPGGGTTTECVHNGNGATSEGPCSNPSVYSDHNLYKSPRKVCLYNRLNSLLYPADRYIAVCDQRVLNFF